jgi:hypothetical protein
VPRCRCEDDHQLTPNNVSLRAGRNPGPFFVPIVWLPIVRLPRTSSLPCPLAPLPIGRSTIPAMTVSKRASRRS